MLGKGSLVVDSVSPVHPGFRLSFSAVLMVSLSGMQPTSLHQIPSIMFSYNQVLRQGEEQGSSFFMFCNRQGKPFLEVAQQISSYALLNRTAIPSPKPITSKRLHNWFQSVILRPLGWKHCSLVPELPEQNWGYLARRCILRIC